MDRPVVRYNRCAIHRRYWWTLLACGCLLASVALMDFGSVQAVMNEKKTSSVAAEIEFNRDVRPILTDNCLSCHGFDEHERKKDFRLDVRDFAVAVNAEGHAAIVPGDSAGSLLIQRITSEDASQIMPPPESHKSLDDGQIELLRRWIDQGAKYQNHWAYEPVKRQVPPEIQHRFIRNDIDRFIVRRLLLEGVEPSPQADRVTLIRRLSFDLTGLPPTVQEVQAFVVDESHDAYEKVVDRLLASPRFGERLAVYWLDLVRYADSVGYHGDQDISQTPYRDYVINAFNSNMPYDRFIREQLAGDLLENPTLDQKIATAFNRLNQTTEEGGAQAKEYLAIYFADRVRNISQIFMGATMGCAQCHDHKFDPFTTKDFYTFGAFFADIEERGVYGGRSRPPMLPLPTPEQAEQEKSLQAQLTEAREAFNAVPQEEAETKKAAEDKVKALQNALNRLKAAILTVPVTVTVKPRTIRILPRGNWQSDAGDIVEPAIPEFFGTLDTGGERATRLDLAKWLCEPDNVFTSRTMVNRLWYLMFGRGIVTSVDDFGGQGTYPSHPDLLDHLAVEFVDSGWDIKHTLKYMVMSATYRQQSRPTTALRQNDPNNQLFARQGRFRLDAEFVRDNALATSGLLVEHIGGVSAKPYQPPGYYDQLNFPKRTYQPNKDANQYRRGVYTHWQRTFLHPMLKAFDAPSREECVARRARSNTPLQALSLLNDPSFVEAARVFAARVMREGGDSTDARIHWAYQQTLSRPPDEHTLGILREVYDTHLAQYQSDVKSAKALIATGNAPVEESLDAAELAAWTSVARVILNLHEVITRY